MHNLWQLQLLDLSFTWIVLLDTCMTVHDLTHWGRARHICVGEQIIIGSDNSLSPGQRQAIIWTNAGILSIGPLETNFSEILIEIYTFSLKKMHLKMSGKWRSNIHTLSILSQLMISWNRFRFDGVKQQTILWANVDSDGSTKDVLLTPRNIFECVKQSW